MRGEIKKKKTTKRSYSKEESSDLLAYELAGPGTRSAATEIEEEDSCFLERLRSETMLFADP